MASADLLTITGDGTPSNTYSTVALATITDLINYPGSSGGHATVAHVSDPLRGGTFYYDSSTTLTDDGGTIFTATGKTSGFWRRQYNPADGLNVTWFGAKGDNSTDDTTAIQAALDVAGGGTSLGGSLLSIKKVVIPPGQYSHTTLFIPPGVLLSGAGAVAESTDRSISKLFMRSDDASNTDGIRLRSTRPTSTGRKYWYGGITNLTLYGNTANNTGWAISCRDEDGDAVAPQDMNFFENLVVRNYQQGGIEFPDNAVPLNVANIKSLNVNGPAIFVGNEGGHSGQSINLNNVSGDQSTGGVIWLDKLDDKTNVIITNLKAQGGPNPAYPAQLNNQVNAIICSDCDNTPVIIDNPNGITTSATYPGTSLSGSISFDLANDKINFSNSFINNDLVRFDVSPGGSLPSNITPLSLYSVKNPTSTTFQIAKVGDSTPIDLSGSPSGTFSLYQSKFLKPGDLISLETKVGTPSFNTTADTVTITVTSGSIVNGDTVKFYSIGDSSNAPQLPGIIAGQIYYVINVTSAGSSYTFQLATSSTGAAIDLSGSSNSVVMYKQITSGNVPKISWRSVAMRIRITDEPGTDPLIIAKTNIPYTTSEGSFNVTRELYNDDTIISKGSEGITFYNTADTITNYEKLVMQYDTSASPNIFKIGTTNGGTSPSRAVKLFSTATGTTPSTSSITVSRGSAPVILFEATDGTTSTGFTPLFKFKGSHNSTDYVAIAVDITDSGTTGSRMLLDAQVNSTSIFKIDSGGKMSIKEGTNAAMGTATLASGTVTISNTRVTANSRIFLTCQGGTVTNLGNLYVSAKTAGTSFTVSSSNAADACTFAWLIIDPA